MMFILADHFRHISYIHSTSKIISITLILSIYLPKPFLRSFSLQHQITEVGQQRLTTFTVLNTYIEEYRRMSL